MRTASGGERYFGVYLGTVLDVNDPDGFGRVRLRTDQYRDTSDDPTWASVARPLAGDVFTVFFTPKEGDQVVLSYVAGDVRQPIVMGYAHAVDPDRKPASESVSATKHAIAVKNVATITFDENDPPTIEIRHATSSARVTLPSDGVVVVEGASVKIGAGASIAPAWTTALQAELLKIQTTLASLGGSAAFGTPYVAPVDASSLGATKVTVE